MSYAAPTLRILSLDAAAGEAQAGFAQIQIIRALMKDIWERIDGDRGEPTDLDIDAMRRSDYFDIIFGSGTGGILAVYLGRLHLTMEECGQFYKELVEEVYAHPRTIWNPFQYKYDPKRLEAVLKKQTTEDGITQDFADKDEGCKAVVLTKLYHNTELPHLLKSYDIQTGKTWEAMRAAIASCHHFPCVKVGLHLLFAAEVGFSNPTGVAWNETQKRYPAPKQKKFSYPPTRGICLVSIGGGTRPPIELHMKGIAAPQWSASWWLYWAKKAFLITAAIFIAIIGRATRLPQLRELAGVAKECESTHDELERRFNFQDYGSFEDFRQMFVPERSGYFRFDFDPYRLPAAEPEVIEPTEEAKKLLSSAFSMVIAVICHSVTSLVSLQTQTEKSERWNRSRYMIEQIANQEYFSPDIDVKTINRLGSAAALLIADIHPPIHDSETAPSILTWLIEEHQKTIERVRLWYYDSDALAKAVNEEPALSITGHSYRVQLVALNFELSQPSMIVHRNSTFSHIGFLLKTHSAAVLPVALEQTNGPVPRWRIPETDSRVPRGLRKIYVVDLSEPFTMALVRNLEEDFPLLLALSSFNDTTTTLGDLIGAKLDGRAKSWASIRLLSSSHDIQGLPCQTVQKEIKGVHSTTILVLLTDEYKVAFPQFRSLVGREPRLKAFAFQAIDFSRGLLHLAICLAEAAIEEKVEGELHVYLISWLKSMVMKLRGVFTNIENSTDNLSPAIAKSLRFLFYQLCEEQPGVVAVRQSLESLQALTARNPQNQGSSSEIAGINLLVWEEDWVDQDGTLLPVVKSREPSGLDGSASLASFSSSDNEVTRESVMRGGTWEVSPRI